MDLFISVLFSLFTSLWCSGITIQAARRLRFGVDEAVGVQKMHSHWVPRLGGIPIFVAYFAGILLLAWETDVFVRESSYVLICLLPAFGIGLLEDITRRAGILPRLVCTMVAAALGWWLLGAGLRRLDIPLIDGWLAASGAFAFVVTLVAAAGVAHAVNIVDGCNGLSSFVSAMVLICIGLVSQWVGDVFVMRIAFLGAAALGGFFFWNFPFGRIFLGDAGAYMIGFLIAECAMLLVTRNPEVSPWFPMLLMAYPVWETLFSMYRRARISLRSVGHPDCLHLHHLVYHRLVRCFDSRADEQSKVLRNSASSAYLWVLALFCAVPAVRFYDDSGWLIAFCAIFIASYTFLYRAVVRFQVPKFLILQPSGVRGISTDADTPPP